MIQHVNTVLIGKTLNLTATTADALKVGDVAVFNELGVPVTTAEAATDAKSLRIGVAQAKVNVTMPDGTVASKANIEFGNDIKKGSCAKMTYSAHVEPVQDKIVITLTSATIVAGNRYVLRIVYKDLFEHPGQFTHTYEVYASDNTAASLASAIVKKINKHANRRVQATAAAGVITLNAMVKDDNEGIDSLNEYSVVNMEATLYTTKPSALLSNQPETVPGATIVKTAGKPGVGYWKQVRDQEVRYMGYKGHVFTGAYPSIEQNRKVVEGALYNVLTIECDNPYLSNDNQYIKTTPITTELYCPVALTALVTLLEGFPVVNTEA